MSHGLLVQVCFYFYTGIWIVYLARKWDTSTPLFDPRCFSLKFYTALFPMFDPNYVALFKMPMSRYVVMKGIFILKPCTCHAWNLSKKKKKRKEKYISLFRFTIFSIAHYSNLLPVCIYAHEYHIRTNRITFNMTCEGNFWQRYCIVLSQKCL